MTLKVYKTDASPPSRSVMITCDLLKLPFELIEVQLPMKEHLTPEYLEKNPLHTVPVLEDGDFTIIDSHAILMYLIDKYGKNDSLYSKDLKKRTLINQKLFFDTGVLFPILKSIVLSVFHDNAKSLTKTQLSDIHNAYGFLEEFLTRSKYLAGDSLTIADLSAITIVTSIAYVEPIDINKYPKTAAWVKYLEEKPYCQKYNGPGTVILGERLRLAFK